MNSFSFDRTLRQVLVVPIVIALLGSAVLAWQMYQAYRTVARLQLSDQAITQNEILNTLVIDEETGLRGYQTTHDRRFLEPYNNANPLVEQQFNQLRDAADNAQEDQLIDDLETTYDAWRQGFAAPLIASVQAGGNTSDVELNLLGKRQMDAIRQHLDAIGRAARVQRDDEIHQWQRQVRITAVLLVLVTILIGAAVGTFTRRRLRQVSDAFRQSHDILRIRAEQTFRSEQKLRTTLHSIGDGVVACDHLGCIESMNEVAEQLTGWTHQESIGLPIEKVFHIIDASTRQPLEDPVAQVKRLNRTVHLSNHTILIRKDGSEIFIDDSGAPIRDKQGALMGVVLVFRDVTLAIRSREALLANEKLAVAGRLAATIAHEIHNPLDSVSNLLFLMDGNSSPEETAHFLQLAKQELDRVTQISRAMLALYREARAPVPIDLTETLRSTLMLLERRFESHGVSARTHLPAQLVVQGFPGELRQVFTNLLTNAAEASSRGGVIDVTAEPAPGVSGGAIVTISDDGPGIPEPVQANLFEPFFSTKGEKGTGLGLWVSRGIMTKHGGSITLESSTDPVDHGTTVTVLLPAIATLNSAAD